MIKVLCVCGCGLGSSFAIEMSAKTVLKKLGVDFTIDHTDVSGASAFDYDVILTQKTFADVLSSDATENQSSKIISLNKLTDKKEIEEKLTPFLKM
ncbi:PTS sugar transporter subunit IIB [Vibrio algivorus]|uniref:PTS ascorbate transporter subunit IIB n=1 Tax=Vibrio algivorus TaxID=1667024 RepID=A0A557NU21_9VIBR|nr:PTS sugar transporter subunit IIB [Vibrio algivorus]TVO31928.1 PTS sugar transporter subunit IIB [Vibrio algivorus]GLT13793.1 PTS ascorbate transporter subunit IIB [Vibrio algivorus]